MSCGPNLVYFRCHQGVKQVQDLATLKGVNTCLVARKNRPKRRALKLSISFGAFRFSSAIDRSQANDGRGGGVPDLRMPVVELQFDLGQK